jgi:hypothetical protein
MRRVSMEAAAPTNNLNGREAPEFAKSKADLTQRATLRQTRYTSLISLP